MAPAGFRTLRRQLKSIVRLANALDVTVSELIADPLLPAEVQSAAVAPASPLASDEARTMEARRTLMRIRQQIMDKSAKTDAALEELAERLAKKPR